MGRKNRYEEAVQPHLTEIEDWIRTMTEDQVAKRLGVSVSAFERYKKAQPELRKALQNGREWLRVDCMSALIKKALGHKETTTKKTVRKVDGVKTTYVEETESYYPPDTGALHLLLKNIDPEWHNDDQTTINIKREQLELEKEKAAANNWEGA